MVLLLGVPNLYIGCFGNLIVSNPFRVTGQHSSVKVIHGVCLKIVCSVSVGESLAG